MGEVGCLKDGNFQNLQVETSSAIGAINIGPCYVAHVDNTAAFVRDDDSIVQWTQPANTVITAIHLFFPSVTYSTGDGNDLGYEVGTTAGSNSGAIATGHNIVPREPDEIIDDGDDGTDITTGAFITTSLAAPTTGASTLAINILWSGAAARTVHLNTTCTNMADVLTPGTVRWIIEYKTTA